VKRSKRERTKAAHRRGKKRRARRGTHCQKLQQDIKKQVRRGNLIKAQLRDELDGSAAVQGRLSEEFIGRSRGREREAKMNALHAEENQVQRPLSSHTPNKLSVRGTGGSIHYRADTDSNRQWQPGRRNKSQSLKKLRASYRITH